MENFLSGFIRPFPGVIRIEPSSLCNLKCIHCPTGTNKGPRGLMDSSTFDLVMGNLQDNIKEIRVVVLYHGGEPFLNKNLLTMVSLIKDLGVSSVKTVSNGMFLNDEIVRDVCYSGLDEIEFSLDGTSFEQNDAIRKGCNGRLVVENILKLIKLKKENGLNKPKVIIATTQFVQNKVNPNLTSIAPKYLSDFFSDEIINNEIVIKPSLALKWPHLNLNQLSIFCDKEDSQKHNYCDDVMNTITIRWNGDVVPCCYDLDSRVILGNIHLSNLDTIWNNDQYVQLRKSIAERNFNPLCDECNIVKSPKYLQINEVFDQKSPNLTSN